MDGENLACEAGEPLLRRLFFWGIVVVDSIGLGVVRGQQRVLLALLTLHPLFGSILPLFHFTAALLVGVLILRHTVSFFS